MARRSRAREVALQLLFQKDQNSTAVPRKVIEKFANDRLGEPDLATFALALYDGTLQHRTDIDRRLSAAAENWRLNRMMPVDRNILRMGAYEVLHGGLAKEVAVVIDEACELARRFGTADSPAFVNGVLDRVVRSDKESPAASAPPA